MAVANLAPSADPNLRTPELVEKMPANTRNVTPNRDFTSDDLEIIKNQICKGSTDVQFKFFLAVCKRTGLDPIQRQIHAVFRKTKKRDSEERENQMTIQTGIDGFRLIAERSGKYEGQVGPFWCGADGVWHDVWLQQGFPKASKVGVKKAGFTEPLWAVARWDSYVQTNWDYDRQEWIISNMWKKLSDVMIAKVAEALALRKAFPNDMAGLYTNEEMAQADGQQQAEKKTNRQQNNRQQNQNPNQNQQQQNQKAQLPPPEKKSFGEYVAQIGQFKGRALKEVSFAELRSYVLQVKAKCDEPGMAPLSGKGLEMIQVADKYLAELEQKAAAEKALIEKQRQHQQQQAELNKSANQEPQGESPPQGDPFEEIDRALAGMKDEPLDPLPQTPPPLKEVEL